MTVTFIIPVKNDARRLQRCLASVAANPGVWPEVIVVDNGSTDESAAVARAAGARVLSVPYKRVGQLRNEAAAIARGALLAFVDADHELTTTWVAAAIDVMRPSDVGAAGALYVAPNDEMIREHARRGGFPADSVAQVRAIIGPTTAE